MEWPWCKEPWWKQQIIKSFSDESLEAFPRSFFYLLQIGLTRINGASLQMLWGRAVGSGLQSHCSQTTCRLWKMSVIHFVTNADRTLISYSSKDDSGMQNQAAVGMFRFTKERSGCRWRHSNDRSHWWKSILPTHIWVWMNFFLHINNKLILADEIYWCPYWASNLKLDSTPAFMQQTRTQRFTAGDIMGFYEPLCHY